MRSKLTVRTPDADGMNDHYQSEGGISKDRVMNLGRHCLQGQISFEYRQYVARDDTEISSEYRIHIAG